jgi:starvation-inducible DNA-binding protein
MQPTHSPLSETIRAQAVELLNKRLAATVDRRRQLKQARWNGRGPGFMTVHELFDNVAGEAES